VRGEEVDMSVGTTGARGRCDVEGSGQGTGSAGAPGPAGCGRAADRPTGPGAPADPAP